MALGDLVNGIYLAHSRLDISRRVKSENEPLLAVIEPDAAPFIARFQNGQLLAGPNYINDFMVDSLASPERDFNDLFDE